MNNLAPLDKKQVNYIERTKKCWLNVAEGGKRGGKNVINVLAFCILLENHPNKLFLLGGVSIASVKLNIVDCDGYGIMNYFSGRCREGKYKNKDCLYVKCADGETKILLISGGSKDGDEKYIKGNSYGMAYITEANECTLKFLNEVNDRTLSSKDRHIFHDLNPKAPAHWYYTEFLYFHAEQQTKDESYGYNYEHFNIFNNLSISNQQLKNVLKTYDKNSIWYKRDILGNRIANAGILFPQIANNKDDFYSNEEIMGYITTGVDIGKNGSAHAFTSQITTRTFSKIKVIKASEISCKEIDEVGAEKTGIGIKLAQLKKGFLNHVNYVIMKYGRIDKIYVDSAEPTIIDFLQNLIVENGYHFPVVGSNKIPINDRIHLIGVLLMQKRISFEKGETEILIRGLQEATQDEEATDDRWLDNGTSDIDILDSFTYGIENFEQQLLKYKII